MPRTPDAPTPRDLESLIRLRTGRRVRDLAVELHAERVILRGWTLSYHVKQLAQHAALGALPGVRVVNAIAVEAGA